MASLTLRKSIEFCKLFGACGDFVDTRKRFQMMALRHSKRMITRDQFEKLFIIAPDLATHIFNLFDFYRRNTINFNSFLLALTVFTGSDNDSKIDLIRDVFSSSRSPDVRRPELIQIVDLIIDSACTLMGVNVHDPAYIAFANDRAKEIVDAVFQPYSTRIAVSVPFYAIHHLIDIHDTFNVLRACVLNMALQTLRSCPEVYRFLRPIRASIASSCGETYSPTNSLQELMFPGQWMRDCNSMDVYNSLVQALISAEKSFEDHPSEDSFENHPIEDSSPYALEIGNRIVSGTEQPGYFIRTPPLKTMNIADPSRSLLFQGYVYKQSWFFQRLRRRWVVIVNNMLYSFCRQDSKRPNLVLSLSGAICDPVENLDTSFLNHFRPLYAFHLSSIICRVTRIIYLPSAELRDRWVYAIRTASRDFELADHYHISSLANSDPFNLISCRGTHSAQDYMLSFVDKSMVKDNELHSMRIESGILRFNEQHVFAPTLALFEDQFKVYFIRQIIPHWIRLDEIISAGGVMSVNSVGLIMRRILSGLNFLYEHHITLGSGVLSPANILISLDNLLQHQVQIVDINLRKYFMPYLDPHTQLYAAPEVEKGYHFGSKAEMWSVGAILYRLLTPGSTQTDLVLAKRGVLNLSRTWGSKDVTTLLKRLLSRNPSRRYCPAGTMRTRFIANATPKRFELHFPKPVSRERYHHYYPAASQSRIS